MNKKTLIIIYLKLRWPQRNKSGFNHCTMHVAKQISITGIRDADQMKRLLSDASKHAASILRQDKQKRRVANFVYNAENDIFAKMCYLQAATSHRRITHNNT